MKKVLIFTYVFITSINNLYAQTANDYIISDNHSSYSTYPTAIFYSRTGHTGTENVAIGSGVLKNNTLGNSNTGLGFNTLQGNITGNENTAIGTKALNVGSGNGVISYSNPTPAPIGNHSNTAIGFEAYLGNVASRNTAVGAKALRLNGGNYTVPFSGVFGNDNVAIGYQTLSKSQSGSGNVAIGAEAMFNYNYHIPMDGGYNISIGYRSMYNAGSANNGLSYNIGIGVNALNSEAIGFGNLAIGRSALLAHTFGSNNIAIGTNALSTNVSGTSNICIGFGAGTNELGSDKLYIENTTSSTPLIGGDFANDIVGINMSVNSLASNPTWKLQVGGDINATGSVRAAGVVLSSDIRFKKNIAPLHNSLSNLLKINAVSYNWRSEDFTERNFSSKKQFGVIAQEIETIFPELVDVDSQGFKSVNYIALVPVMIQAIKELSQKITILENQNSHSSNSK